MPTSSIHEDEMESLQSEDLTKRMDKLEDHLVETREQLNTLAIMMQELIQSQSSPERSDQTKQKEASPQLIQSESIFSPYEFQSDPVEVIRENLQVIKKLKIKGKAPSLKSSNPADFTDWRIDFEAYLERLNLSWFLLLPTYEEEEINRQFTEQKSLYLVANIKFYSLLIGVLPRDLRRIVCSFSRKDGALAWKTLLRSVMTPSSGRINHVRKKLRNSEMKPYQDPETFLSYIVRLAEELRLLGEHVPDHEIEALILEKLPETYDDFVKFYRRLDKEKKSLMRLKQEIEEEYETMKYRSPKSFGVFTKKKGKHRPNRLEANSTVMDKLKHIQCWNCKEYGHYSSKCPKKKEQTSRRSNNSAVGEDVAYKNEKPKTESDHHSEYRS